MIDRLLRQWDDSLSDATHAKLDRALDRRSFLSKTLKAGTAVMLAPSLINLSACAPDPAKQQADLVRSQPWLTFATVQQHLFPDDGNGPDARAINATLYLKFVLDADDTDPEVRTFIYDGVGWLDDLANKTHQSRFTACTVRQQAELIETIAQSRSGERWLSYLILYILEALLSDPVYGGNPDAVGWRWLEHQPGFPRPPADRIYTRLL